MSMLPPNAYITPASPVVVEQITRLNEKADKLDRLARAGIEDLFALNINNVELDPRLNYTAEELEALLNQLGDLPDFDPNADWLAGLGLSAGDENFIFNPEIYQYLRQTLPEYDIPAMGQLPAVPAPPAEPGEPEEIAPPARPDLPVYAAPDVDIDIPPPEYEDYTAAIPFPELRPITLPTAPIIDYDDIVFEGVRPEFTAIAPDAEDFAFQNSDYQSLILDETKAKVLEIFNGQTGLPVAVENALFERMREQEQENAQRDIDTARNDWAARGWKQPPGMLAAAEYRARRDAGNRIAAANRDQMIQHHQAALEMLKTALSTAMQMEDVWSRMFMSAEDRRLQAAKMKLDLAVQVFNALINRYQAEAQMFSVDAQVFNAKFQAAQAKLEIYTAELRGKQLIGELNEQDVRIFAQRIGALEVNAQVYRAKVEGFRALFDALDAKVGVYRAQIESNQGLLSGYETDVRAFGERLRAQTARDDRFKVRADIYSTNMGAWKTRFDALLAEQERSFKIADLRRDTFASNTERVRAFVDGEQARISALRDKYAALASEINAKGDVEKARYTLMLSLAQAKIARFESASNMLMKNGEITIQSALTAENMMLRAQETATTTLAQMAAGYTSAANVNASISDSSSSSISYSFSGELEVN